MATKAQIAANQRNAVHSAGPKTDEGKGASSGNALKHGLLSSRVVVPTENADEYARLAEELREELKPAGPLEEALVNRIAGALWRLRRAETIEAGLYAWGYYGVLAGRAKAKADSSVEHDLNLDLGILMNAAENKAEHKAAQEEQQEHEQMQDSDIATLGYAFIRDAGSANAFQKLARYESELDRSLHKALHELERRQAIRNKASAQSRVVDVAFSAEPAGEPGTTSEPAEDGKDQPGDK